MNKWTETTARECIAYRSQGRCELGCGRVATNAAHRQPRSGGGGWHPANLLHLCGSGTTGCHGRATAQPGWAFAEGIAVPRGQDFLTVPVRLRHPVYGAFWYLLHDDGTLSYLDDYATPSASVTGLVAPDSGASL